MTQNQSGKQIRFEFRSLNPAKNKIKSQLQKGSRGNVCGAFKGHVAV